MARRVNDVIVICGDANTQHAISEVLEPVRRNPAAYDLESIEVFEADQWLAGEHGRFGFDVRKFCGLLATRTLGRTLLYSDQVTSTQTLLFDKLYLLPASRGPLFLCHQQVAGKGRGGNSWESPAGCLMFTLKISLIDPSQLAFVQYLASLSMVKATKTFPGCAEFPLRIKWPNDLYIGDRVKIGGVLCQSTANEGMFDICIGLGLNVENARPTTCLNAAYHELLEQKQPVIENDRVEGPFNREALMAAFLAEFERDLAIFLQEGFASFEEEYTKTWLHTGQIVDLVAQNKKVIIRGLCSNGFLRATDADPATGEEYELHPDGNTFDFLKGLIIQKVLNKF
jgi:biotin--protein ligase